MAKKYYNYGLQICSTLQKSNQFQRFSKYLPIIILFIIGSLSKSDIFFRILNNQTKFHNLRSVLIKTFLLLQKKNIQWCRNPSSSSHHFLWIYNPSTTSKKISTKILNNDLTLLLKEKLYIIPLNEFENY